MLTSMLAPLVREVFAPAIEAKEGLKASLLHSSVTSGLLTSAVVNVLDPSSVTPVSVDSVCSAAQLVGLSMKP